MIFGLHPASKLARKRGKLVDYDSSFWEFPTVLYEQAKLDRVDYKWPGLACCVFEENAVRKILIDGKHRMLKAKQAGAKFQVYLLNQRDSQRCLSRTTRTVGNRKPVVTVSTPKLHHSTDR